MHLAVSTPRGRAPGVAAEGLIELSSVSKDYDSGAGIVRAMRDVDLTIMRGEFVAIVGTSGSGKSTMMNILGCLDRPTFGRYLLAGIDAGARGNDARALVRNRLIGFIFQGFNLLPRTTALENVELPLQYRGVAARVRRKRALAALASVGLAARGHHTPNQLSGGQQQRVAIARALVTDPPLLLADEPTGNLDTRTSLEVLALLQGLNRDRGITIVLVTHEQDIAACASRVITMRDGRIVSDIVQDAPVDAAAELARLAPPQEYVPAETERGGQLNDISRKMGGPVPLAVFAAMFGGALGGSALGLTYDRVVLGAVSMAYAWIPLLCMVLSEAWIGARYGRRRIGRPLTSDQRVRLALWYTVAQSVAVVPILWLFAFKALDTALVNARVAVVGAVALVVAIALLRYLTLTLFSPKR